MRNKLFFAITASLVSASLYANDGAFNTMDANQDGNVTKDEFHSNISDAGVYADFDLDKDGYLTKDEFSETNFDDEMYEGWDVNKDNRLDDNEFSDGAFLNYDEDEDGHWNFGEWDDAGDAGFWDI